MQGVQQKTDPRRGGLTGLGAVSLFLAAVIVLASTPAVLKGTVNDPAHPVSRVGSQLRRLAAAVPVRLVSKATKRHQHRPLAALANRAEDPISRRCARPRFATPVGEIAPLSCLAPQFLDLPPPVLAA